MRLHGESQSWSTRPSGWLPTFHHLAENTWPCHTTLTPCSYSRCGRQASYGPEAPSEAGLSSRLRTRLAVTKAACSFWPAGLAPELNTCENSSFFWSTPLQISFSTDESMLPAQG